jgi:hypothetical protein
VTIRKNGIPEGAATEAEILKALRAHMDGCYFMEHPRTDIGWPDAMAVALDGSFQITGFEVKRSRADWLAELKSLKNRSFAECCDFWYIVAVDGVVLPDDLQRGEGLYVVRPGPEISLERRASDLNPHGTFTRSFAERIFTAIHGAVPLSQHTKAAYDEGYRQAVNDLLSCRFFGSMEAPRLRALIEALNQRTVFRLRKQMERLHSDVTNLWQEIDGQLKALPPYRDWETKKTSPPGAEKLAAKFRKDLLGIPGLAEISRNSPLEFERIVQGHLDSHYEGRPTMPL